MRQSAIGAIPGRDSQGPFDYYVLSLSWSPEFCAAFPQNNQCAAHPGLIVHGLWPQNYDGSWPSYCHMAPLLDVPPPIYQLMTASLVSHEWASHGTCSGLTSVAYFALMLKLFQKIALPRELSPDSKGKTESIARLKRSIVAANPNLRYGGVSIVCEGRYLEEVQFCFSRAGTPLSCRIPTNCQGVAVTIRANTRTADGVQARSK